MKEVKRHQLRQTNQHIKERRREGSSTDSCNGSRSNDENESSGGSEGGRGQNDIKKDSRNEIFLEERKTNQHLAMFLRCLRQMNSNIHERCNFREDSGVMQQSTTSSDHQLRRKSEENKREEVEGREEGSTMQEEGRERDYAREENYRKRQRRKGKIMVEYIITGSQDEAQERTSSSVRGIEKEKTLIVLVCINVSSLYMQ